MCETHTLQLLHCEFCTQAKKPQRSGSQRPPSATRPTNRPASAPAKKPAQMDLLAKEEEYKCVFIFVLRLTQTQ